MDLPRVGIGIAVKKGNNVLLGKRINSHGEGTWAFPGGKLDYKESLEECTKRELYEETGLEITNLRKGPYTNDVHETGEHFVTLIMIGDYVSGEPIVKEPHKCKKWEWFDPDNFPEPLFLPLKSLLKNGFKP